MFEILCGAEARCGACFQVCGEKQRFEKLMEHFRNEDNNIDFMVSGVFQKLPFFSILFLPWAWPCCLRQSSGREGVGGVLALGLVAEISQIWGFKVSAGV